MYWVSGPWRGCVVSLKLVSGHSYTCFRPLAGMCCVPCECDRISIAKVSVPWRGCVVSIAWWSSAARIVFPSPGGDVLCRASSSPSNRRPQFPSPGGDVLCRVEQDFERLPLEFPSPGGDVLCLPIDVFMTSYFVFPSPGGDVLCRACPVHGQRPTRVSVPWRGCVVSLTVIFSFRNFRGFRPLAGMCCVSRPGAW